MATEKPFASYAEVEMHALKLRLRSETAALRFGNHCHALADKEVRSTLIKGAVSDTIHGMKPLQTAAELMTGGGITSQVLMGLFTRKGGFTRRALTSLAAAVMPGLLAKVPWSNALGKLSDVLHTKRHQLNGNDAG